MNVKWTFFSLFCLLFAGNLKSEPIDSTVWALIKGKKSPISLSYLFENYCDNPSLECGVGNVGDKWTFPLIAGMKLTAFKNELPIYCNSIDSSKTGDLKQGLNIFAGYGVCFNGNWDEHWSSEYVDSIIFPGVMAQLKKPEIRKALWAFLEPALRHQVKTMEFKFKGIVVISYEYVADYFKNYDLAKAREWYNKDVETEEFAYKDYLGNKHPSRKITAMIERLMFKWKVADYNSVKQWLGIIGNWLKKILGSDYAKSKAYWGK
jgi:hypothetical protein